MISEIKRLLNEQHEAAARCDRSQQYAVAASYDREIEKRQQAAQKAFARRNGWIVTQSLIGAERLIPREKRPEGTWWGWGRFVGAVSDRPRRLRPTRSPSQHLAPGLYAVHRLHAAGRRGQMAERTDRMEAGGIR